MKRVTIREILWVLAWSAGVMAVTAVPYGVARRWAGPEREFAGFLWGVDEGNVYLAWVRQASEGRVLLRNQYTTKDQSPHFVNVFLSALGQTCRLTGFTPLQVFAGTRYLCGVFCLLAFYLLVSEFTGDRLMRAASLGLASMSSGLGWLVVLGGKSGVLLPGLSAFPMDVADGWQSQPEAIIFSSLLLNPLFSFSLGLISLTMLHVSRLATGEGWIPAVRVGLLLLLLGNVHGYDIIPIHATILLWLVCCWLTGKISVAAAGARYIAILAISAAAPIWASYGVRADPSYAAKIDTPTLSARPFDVAIGYGLVLVLAIVGAWMVSNADGEAPHGGASITIRKRNCLVLVGAVVVGCAGIVAQQLGASGIILALPVFLLPFLAAAVLLGRRDADTDQPMRLHAPAPRPRAEARDYTSTHFADDQQGTDRWRALLLLVWAACGAAVIYLPVSFQRKMIEGLHIPLCILGGWALVKFARGPARELGSRSLGRGMRGVLAVAAIIMTVPSNVVFVGEALGHVGTNNRMLLHVLAPPAYLSTAEMDGMRWLGENATERDIVLSSSLTGNHIPAHARCTVVVGHWAETLQFGQYASLVGRFYDPQSSTAVREAIIGATSATYVWWGPQERVLQEAMGGPSADPCARLPGLRLVYIASGVRIYASG